MMRMMTMTLIFEEINDPQRYRERYDMGYENSKEGSDPDIATA